MGRIGAWGFVCLTRELKEDDDDVCGDVLRSFGVGVVSRVLGVCSVAGSGFWLWLCGPSASELSAVFWDRAMLVAETDRDWSLAGFWLRSVRRSVVPMVGLEERCCCFRRRCRVRLCRVWRGRGRGRPGRRR